MSRPHASCSPPPWRLPAPSPALLRYLAAVLTVPAWLVLGKEAPASSTAPPLEYIDTSFENASPLWYEPAPDGSIRVHLLYDHERASPNRAAGHIHFRLHAPPGTRLTLEFKNLDNVWNGRPGSVAPELQAVVVSEDGLHWQPQLTESLPGNRVRLGVTMPGPQLYVARVEPYRLSDFDRLLTRCRTHPLVHVTRIGDSLQGRPLELLRVGRPEAPGRVFLRARAHPWEAGGNWVIEGLLDRLLEDSPEARRFLARYVVYTLPLANPDGVARGLTRFNLAGRDLNRDWDRPADPKLAPENAALEAWLEGMRAIGQAPHLALDLHNDGGGRLHLSRPPILTLDRHLARMATFETLLRQHTWFTEGSTGGSYRNAGTLGDGWLERFGIDAAVLELHCHWIAGVAEHPTAPHWRAFGAGLAQVFYDYFERVTP
ncbi:MAG: succinylglutamate desuccinylase/aspartoacylase family protein [Verrucomicrobiales bacterium]|nr:succinylglutamate desuccinylase/aspartoacylase family protein [Verrucomicrobiales bacterium]